MTSVAVLGTGIMGAPMARNIAASGHEVRAWNRSPEKAEPLAGSGVEIADSPAEAVAGAEVVITMLSDGPVVAGVMADATDGLSTGATWLQMSTVGVEWSARLARQAAALGLTFVDAPVLGTRQPAEAGRLIVLAAGPEGARDIAAPVFDAIASRTVWLDAVGDASRLKLVVNAWIVALTAALAESTALAEHLEIDPRTFLEVIDGGAIGLPYAQIKGPMMIAGRYPTSFPARLARKDVGLVLEAAGGDLRLRVAAAAAEHFADTVEAGFGDADMAAVRTAVTTGDG